MLVSSQFSLCLEKARLPRDGSVFHLWLSGVFFLSSASLLLNLAHRRKIISKSPIMCDTKGQQTFRLRRRMAILLLPISANYFL